MLQHNFGMIIPDEDSVLKLGCTVCRMTTQRPHGLNDPCFGCDTENHRLYRAIMTYCPCYPDKSEFGHTQQCGWTPQTGWTGVCGC